MSGSSLDGIDMAYCKIQINNPYTFTIIAAATFPFSNEEFMMLKNCSPDIHYNYQKEDVLFAKVSANAVNNFLQKNNLPKPDAIASHGHTVFHFPALGKTKQIGNGQLIANLTGCKVIYDFRSADVEAGGQGAPLVPLCDAIFFNNYHACLNIGGIANISFDTPTGRIGFDICGANQLLNYIAQTIDLPFDENGELAATGFVDEQLLSELNACTYFQLPYPKSLDNHFVRKYFIERITAANISVNDKLATATYHIAQQITKVIQQQNTLHENYQLLVTGGGAFNIYLIQLIEKLAGIKIILPTNEIIQFKEALAMCLMGVEKLQNKPNFLPSVTGARFAVSGGVVVVPEKRD